jgi:hypothetical protein
VLGVFCARFPLGRPVIFVRCAAAAGCRVLRTLSCARTLALIIHIRYQDIRISQVKFLVENISHVSSRLDPNDEI